MEHIELGVNLRPLSYEEMLEVEGGFPWAAVLITVVVGLFVQLPDAIKGFIDGWNAYTR